MSRTAAALALLALAASLPAPAASTGPAEITVAQFRVGDRFVYSLNESDPEGPWVVRWSVEIVGSSSAEDRFGIARDTIEIRHDWTTPGGEIDGQIRCQLLRGGREEVRQDMLFVKSEFSREFLALVPYMERTITWTSFFLADCDVPVAFGGRTFAVGETLPVSAFEGDWRWPGSENGWVIRPGWTPDSAPAVATDFHGRNALEFAFYAVGDDGGEARFNFTFADGLPGVVRSEMWYRTPEGLVGGSLDELIGFEAGAGEAVVDAGARLPTVRPGASLLPWAPEAVDDAPWSPAYPFGQALRALEEDPVTDLDGWRATHPDAVLLGAYLRPISGRAPGSVVASAWDISFADETGTRAFRTERADVTPSVVPWPDALRRPSIQRFEDDPTPGPNGSPADVVDPASLAAAVEDGGIAPEDVNLLAWWIGGPKKTVPVFNAASVANVADGVPPADARWVLVLGTTGGLFATLALVDRAPVERIVAPDPGAGLRSTAADRAAGLDVPALATGLTLAGLALIAARAVGVALYTRLRRSRLLADPTRARLYEAIRAEPGIHQAALVARVGIETGTARHHLQHLVRGGLVGRMEDGGFTRYVAAGAVAPHVARTLGLMRSDTVRAVYGLYTIEPDASLRAAARRLGMSAPSVYRAKRRLEAAGLLPAAAPAQLLSPSR
ncbi:MAG TPA: winged helix-turn-helix transcriptional regulator [Candidatus Thermoplasmatota archaeon]|nr:winged helix-turn-helix transcriptional regulator [Candidatus Thermoplasmatota archaeon]